MACCEDCAGAFEATIGWTATPNASTSGIKLTFPADYIGMKILKWKIEAVVYDSSDYRPVAVSFDRLPIQSCIVDMRPATPTFDTRAYIISPLVRFPQDGEDSPWFDAGGMDCPNSMQMYAVKGFLAYAASYPPSTGGAVGAGGVSVVLKFIFSRDNVNKMLH